MNIVLISIGKKHDTEFLSAIDMYTKRMNRFAYCQWHLIPDSGIGPAGASKEAALVREKLTPKDTVIVLDEKGTALTSAQLSYKITESVPPGNRLVFVIGGAYGIDSALKNSADFVWSLGSLTFPHQLVRIILAEQIYRAFAIANNLPYHHA